MKKEYILQLLTQFKDGFVTLFVTLSVFLGPIAPMVGAAFLLVLFDTLTGSLVAKRNKVFNSTKFSDVIGKIVLYGSAIVIGQYLDNYVIQELRVSFLDHILNLFLDTNAIETISRIKITSGIAALILFREIVSIDENWEKYFGWSFFKSIKFIGVAFFDKFKNKTKS